ncbi:MAG: metal-sensing transcriptional repressor [Candidatus Mcinerneyibacterium aminivorans]|uniref:Metal-sensing transcriptional repressor n=1 Tax=Candidatus Mcinerneyibacterium aminivorans TaxID=2703815 RepID=A0A5D0MDQ8_9BACT|nr:MAG: metal-sensing transcriptional repressor [Candidatus Mcinerneyibacterium aminivorans]
MSNKKCEHKQHHSDELKKNMINRLKRIEGQIRGISNMIGNDIYCDDILNQIASVESALNGVKKILLKAHMDNCVTDRIKEGDEEIKEEFLNTIYRIMK